MQHPKSPRTATRRGIAKLGTILSALVVAASAMAAVPASAADSGPLPDSLAVNFQPANKDIPAGFVPDAGQSYSPERGYGWNLSDGRERQCVDRHFATNQEIDTHCHATSYYWDVDGFWTPHDSPASWRADLEAGTYEVTVTVGDSKKMTPGIAHSVQVEGVDFFDREPTSPSMTWASTTREVIVDDNTLDVTFDGGEMTKIISITAVRTGDEPIPTTQPPSPTQAPTTTQAPATTEAPGITQPPAPQPGGGGDFSLLVNFQTPKAEVPSGFVADSGREFDAQRGFGWSLPDGAQRQCGDRNAVPDQVIDTFCHAVTRYENVNGRWTSIDSPASWKATVPNGEYEVTVTVGESRYHFSSIAHSAQVEGVVFHDRVATTVDQPTASASKTVTVADGVLDLTFDNGSKTKVVAITIISAGGSTPTTVTPPTTVAPPTTVTPPTTITPPTTVTPPNPEPSAPVIDVWSGDTLTVGTNGVPQRFVNIPGNVSDDGTVVSLTARLDDGPPRTMRIGPGDRRLIKPGDFNVDIPLVDMHPGINRVTLVATDDDGLSTTRVVSVDYSPTSIRPNMIVDWSNLDSVDEAAHIVDGKWRITNDGLRTVDPGYDRIVSVGHITWESYEVLTSFTVHGITPDHLDRPSNGAGVGIAAHWTGHSSNPAGENPLVGFLPDEEGFVPLGALAWVRWKADGNRAEMIDHRITVQETSGYQIAEGETHLIRLQVTGGAVPTYRWRVWRVDQPEPTGWQEFTTTGAAPTPRNGSIALFAHEADVTFGKVTITPFG